VSQLRIYMLSVIISVMKVSLDTVNAKLLVYVVLAFVLLMVGMLGYKVYSGQTALGNAEEQCKDLGVGTHTIQYAKSDGTTGNRVLMCNEDGTSQIL